MPHGRNSQYSSLAPLVQPLAVAFFAGYSLYEPSKTGSNRLTKGSVFSKMGRMKSEYELKNRVKELRARLNMRQADLATEVEVTRQTILAIEKGRLNPSVALSLRIARVLREPVDYVFYLDHRAALSSDAVTGTRTAYDFR